MQEEQGKKNTMIERMRRNRRYNLFKKHVDQHKVVYTYCSGTVRTSYEGTQQQEANYAFTIGKTHHTVLVVEWWRNGEKYKTW